VDAGGGPGGCHALAGTGAGPASGHLPGERAPDLAAFGLQPWRVEDFEVSPDPLLIDKIRDVIGLYLAPSAGAAVFAVGREAADPGLSGAGPRRCCR
jgi:hypothetical protein